MYGTKIIVRDIPTLESRPGRRKQPEAYRTEAASQGFSLPVTPEMQEAAFPNPLLNGIFVQLGMTTDVWLVMRTVASGI